MAELGTTPLPRGSGQVEVPEADDAPFEDLALIGDIPVEAEEDPDAEGVVGTVLPHVQVYASAMCAATGACTASTYEDHHPHSTRALDILVSSAYGRMPASFAMGDEVAEFTLREWSSHGVMYLIWRQRINSNDGRGWRAMGDRENGDITQNHFDHCHVSFLEGGGDAASGNDDLPKEEFLMSLTPKEQEELLDKVKNTNLTLARLETILADPQTGIAVRLARLDDKVKELGQRLP